MEQNSTPERDKLILAFHKAQEENPQNYISRQKLQEIAKEFDISLAEISGILSFYTMFSTEPRGKYIIRLCDSLACRVSGSVDIYLYLQQKLGIKNGETTQDGLFSLEVVNCLGTCHTAPNIMINDETYGNVTPDKVDDLLLTLTQEAAHA